MNKKYQILVNGENHDVEVIDQTNRQITFRVEGRTYQVEFNRHVLNAPTPPSPVKIQSTPHHAKNPAPITSSAPATAAGEKTICAPMFGLVTELLVEVGQEIAPGQVVLRVEAMKMENNIHSPANAKVERVNVAAGDMVDSNNTLIHLSVRM